MNYAVWNTLHDGSIESVSGAVAGDVILVIGIRYLCQELPTTAQELEVHLQGCTFIRYEPFGENPVTTLEELSMCGIEILSAEREDSLVTIICVDGYLKLNYEDAEIRLRDGSIISQAELEHAADRYWAKWSLKNKTP